MDKTMDKNRLDDDSKPPPCPWCMAPAIKELTDPASDVRWFTCASCARMFYIRCELQTPK
jgi:hypothetical protein